MKAVRLDFCDFFPGFPKTNNFFSKLLRERFFIELCDQPDLIFTTPVERVALRRKWFLPKRLILVERNHPPPPSTSP